MSKEVSGEAINTALQCSMQTLSMNLGAVGLKEAAYAVIIATQTEDGQARFNVESSQSTVAKLKMLLEDAKRSLTMEEAAPSVATEEAVPAVVTNHGSTERRNNR